MHVAKSNLSGKVLPTIIGDNVTVGELCSGLCMWEAFSCPNSYLILMSKYGLGRS